MHSVNSKRAYKLDTNWGKEITFEALNYWAKLFDKVKDSKTLRPSDRENVFKKLREVLFYHSISIPVDDDDVLTKVILLFVTFPDEKRIFVPFRFLTGGCEEALKNDAFSKNPEIENLLRILEGMISQC